jgi:methylthioribose-1-phosphate isomerase
LFLIVKGTYQLAISAKYHGVPFIVAAPTTSIDLSLKSGDEIEIEERNGAEVRFIRGLNQKTAVIETVQIAAEINCWNPAFDVAPASLISAIATEREVVVKKEGADVFVLVE